MDDAEQAALLAVKVAYSPAPHRAEEVAIVVAPGATVADALRLSGVLERHRELGQEPHAVGIWGRLRPLDTLLREGDRVEVYRPLQVDPKEARRLRQRRQREAKTGAR